MVAIISSVMLASALWHAAFRLGGWQGSKGPSNIAADANTPKVRGRLLLTPLLFAPGFLLVVAAFFLFIGTVGGRTLDLADERVFLGIIVFVATVSYGFLIHNMMDRT